METIQIWGAQNVGFRGLKFRFQGSGPGGFGFRVWGSRFRGLLFGTLGIGQMSSHMALLQRGKHTLSSPITRAKTV